MDPIKKTAIRRCKSEGDLSRYFGGKSQSLRQPQDLPIHYFTAGQGGPKFSIDSKKLTTLEAGFFFELAHKQQGTAKNTNHIVPNIKVDELAILIDLLNTGKSERMTGKEIPILTRLAKYFKLPKVLEILSKPCEPTPESSSEDLRDPMTLQIFNRMKDVSEEAISQRRDSVEVCVFSQMLVVYLSEPLNTEFNTHDIVKLSKGLLFCWPAGETNEVARVEFGQRELLRVCDAFNLLEKWANTQKVEISIYLQRLARFSKQEVLLKFTYP